MNCPDPYAAALLALKTNDPIARDQAIRTLKQLIVPEARRTAAQFWAHRIEVDDLVQAAELKVVRLAEKYEYDAERPPAGLVVIVARRAALSAAKDLVKQRPLDVWSLQTELFKGGNRDGNHAVGDILQDPDMPEPGDAAADTLDARIALRILNRELSALQRAVWIAKHLRGMQYWEIAETLSVGREKPLTIKSVDNALSRANQKFERLRQVQRIYDSECRIGKGRV